MTFYGPGSYLRNDFDDPALDAPLVLSPPSAAATAVPIGEPSPVQASHPGPAENAPLFPEVMS